MSIFLLCCFSLCAESQKQSVSGFPEVDKIWLRAAPPGVHMMAAYVTLKNATDRDMKLVGAYSPAFGMAEIHKTILENGVAKMREQKKIILKSGQELSMQPGGLHIMLMRPKSQPEIGEKVRICLIYEDNGKQLVQHLDFPVKQSNE